jgi:hypothetical protein
MNRLYLKAKLFIKNNFKTIIIIILFILLLFQTFCNKREVVNSLKTITVIDTVYIETIDTIKSKVVEKSVKYIEVPKYINYVDTKNIDTCNKQFTNLLKEFSKKTVYEDKVNIMMDSTVIGDITVVDTVWQNKLYGDRIYYYNYKVPQITKTITIEKTLAAKVKSQLYIGATLLGSKQGLEVVVPGLLFKTKKDKIYNVAGGVDLGGNIYFGGGIYWKIKLSK